MFIGNIFLTFSIKRCKTKKCLLGTNFIDQFILELDIISINFYISDGDSVKIRWTTLLSYGP